MANVAVVGDEKTRNTVVSIINSQLYLRGARDVKWYPHGDNFLDRHENDGHFDAVIIDNAINSLPAPETVAEYRKRGYDGPVCILCDHDTAHVWQQYRDMDIGCIALNLDPRPILVYLRNVLSKAVARR